MGALLGVCGGVDGVTTLKQMAPSQAKQAITRPFFLKRGAVGGMLFRPHIFSSVGMNEFNGHEFEKTVM